MGVVRAVALAAFLPGAWAQAQTTDRAGIEGKVVDQGGGVLAGVTASIASPALLGGSRTTVTDSEGRYRFAALPAGEYELKFELSGFTPVERNLRLVTGFVATINETLQVAGITETVSVSPEAPVVDVKTTGVSTNLGEEALEELPTSRSMWQIMALAPGIRVSGVDVGGGAVGTQQSYSNYGTSVGGNKPSLDGVDTREDATGAGFYYDYGAFQEVQIKAMGNDAEMAVPGTQFVGILKSGGDQFHGSAYGAWESPDWQSDNLTDELEARGAKEGNPLKEYHDYNFDLGGPIVKNRLWFYGSYRHQLIKSGVVGYLESPGPDNAIGTGDDVPGNYLVTLENITGKLTGQINPRHRFSAFVQAQTKDYPERNADAFRFKESTWHQIFKPLAAKIDWSWTASDRTYVNAFVGLWKYVTDAINWTEDAPAYDTVTLRYWGRFNTSPYVGGRKRWQYNASVAQFVPRLWGGSHDLKLGVEITDEDRTYDAPAKTNGADYQLRFQNGSPYQVILYNYPYSTLNKMTTQSAYLRDAWRFGDRATVNVGLRWERYHVYVPAQSKPEGRFYPAVDFPATDVVTWNNWAPRIGLSLPLGSSNRTVVKATYGWYNFATQGNYADPYNPNAAATTTYRWNDLNGNRDFNDGELGTFVSATGASASAINPDLKQPKTHEATASLETQIASNFSARASYVYRREVDRYQNVNVLRPYEAYSVAIPNVDPGPDGVRGTADDGGPITVYDYAAEYAGSAFVRNMDVNTDGYENSYHSIEVAAQKRMSNKWQLVTSFLATYVDEWRSDTALTTPDGIPESPNQDYFPKAQYWEWAFKLAGSYDLPWGLQAAGTFTSQSGSVWGRDVRFTAPRISAVIIRVEDPAARRLPTQNILNLRLEKRQKIGPGTAAFQLDVFNVTNTNVETGVTARSGASFGQITGIIPPRIARLGVSYTF
jgi:outer membrane receptor protein involved in Fe transport